MSDAPVPAPASVRLHRNDQTLELVWPDGLAVRLPWSLLRANCPSAGERMARMTPPDPLAVLKSIPSAEITAVRMVGSYAIAFTWADGHSAGIYTWGYLRELSELPNVQDQRV